MPNRHFLRSDIFTVAMVYYFYFRLFSPNESNSKKVLYFLCDFGYIINRDTILTYLS